MWLVFKNVFLPLLPSHLAYDFIISLRTLVLQYSTYSILLYTCTGYTNYFVESAHHVHHFKPEKSDIKMVVSVQTEIREKRLRLSYTFCKLTFCKLVLEFQKCNYRNLWKAQQQCTVQYVQYSFFQAWHFNSKTVRTHRFSHISMT